MIAAVEGTKCTVSTVNAAGVDVDGYAAFATSRPPRSPATLATTARPPRRSSIWASRHRWGASRIRSIRQAARCERKTSFRRHAGDHGPTPVINDVVNLKAQYGLDTDNDGDIDAWQDATDGSIWSAANLPDQPLATLRQIRAVRIAIVTRSAQYEKDAVTHRAAV